MQFIRNTGSQNQKERFTKPLANESVSAIRFSHFLNTLIGKKPDVRDARTFSLREFVLNSRHPDPCGVEGGSRGRFEGHDPRNLRNLGNPGINSKNKIKYGRHVT